MVPRMKTTESLDRSEYRTAQGVAAWWPKDGLWHVALPCADPNPENGLRTGGFKWSDLEFDTRNEAVTAIENPKLCYSLGLTPAQRKAVYGYRQNEPTKVLTLPSI